MMVDRTLPLLHLDERLAAVAKPAGLLVHPLDIPGVAVLLSAGRRVAAVWKPAALGALVGLAVRMGGHMLLA